MMELRTKALAEIVSRQPCGSIAEDESLTDVYGCNCYNEKAMRETLPTKVYEKLQHSILTGGELDHDIADMVANGMKLWAMKNGATHYTHWFQPITGATAEKHDSFISIFPNKEKLLLEFSGMELIKGEPDASSFPSGGLRSTYEARGYTVWDPSSPAFIRKTTNGVTLCIPTAFCSWTGEALDHKTPQLRSLEVLNTEAVQLLHLMGYTDVKNVYSTLGIEQEFFLIDRGFWVARPDLVACGRTLIGARPPKSQELHDHYFGTIHDRILSCVQEIEWELWKLGMPLKTRHNEVAPSQYEMAPIFERSPVASDHNMVLMETLRTVATKHNFACLLHEKPFAGCNGSGKHNNFSLSTDTGSNLLEPGHDAEVSARFIVFLTAIIRAVDTHADLLRSVVANPGQEHRLGANEAPPAIISVYLGSELDNICRDLMGGDDDSASAQSSPDSAKDGASLAPTPAPSPRPRSPRQKLQLGVSVIPHLPRDTSDRNRTSPFAFTGNKFEFRVVGSSQSCALPNAVLNSIVAESIKYLRIEIMKEMGITSLNQLDAHRHPLSSTPATGNAPRVPLRDAMQRVVQRTLRQHYRIVFNGNGYDEEWVTEAKSRGLANLRTTPEAVSVFASEKNIQLLESLKVMTAPEIKAQQHIMLENYSKSINIEARCIHQMALTQVLPAGIQYQNKLSKSIKATLELLGVDDVTTQKEHLRRVSSAINGLILSCDKLSTMLAEVTLKESPTDEESRRCAEYYCNTIIPQANIIRGHCDVLESLVDNELWPLPKYSEMLFLR